jgi:hypothetical protein
MSGEKDEARLVCVRLDPITEEDEVRDDAPDEGGNKELACDTAAGVSSDSECSAAAVGVACTGVNDNPDPPAMIGDKQ